ncbi:aspartate aminotransferase family protein [Cucumibacter marinus]|uniref:aspartate aminotransferase family protein n=1 Tax=Cucumibacter marinus TaxID=1121252 RepID=UPI0003FE9CE2|nr:aspartate aminotransferase family protein [Cucumibacter marinus]
MSALYGSYARSELAFERGEGVRLFTADGSDYLDFAGGIAVTALGHAHPHLVERLKTQGEKLWHVSNIFQIPQQEELGRRLAEATFADRVFFTNSGAEAMECAIKTARRYFHDKGEPGRYEVITFKGAFHGRTLGTIAAGGNPSYLEGFGPALPGFVQVEPGDLALVKNAISDKTCAILIEPVQGEGGVTAFPDEFLRGLRKLCDENGLLLILDEIQCGYGRTGKFFAHEWAGITPDLMAVAKGIGGGFPLGACLATEEVGKVMVPGTHGSTYGGNPLACSIGNAVLDVVLEPGFIPHVEEMGKYLAWQLQQLMQKYPDHITEIRGRGLIAGFRLSPEIATRDFVARLRQHHLLTVAAGENVVRLLPPLIVEKADIDEAIEKITQAFDELDA